MTLRGHCAECGPKLPTDVPLGFCPACAPRGALTPDSALGETAVAEQMADRIGLYQLIEKLREGGCGVVFLAEQSEPLRRRVALKIVKPGMDTRQAIRRFEAERRALEMQHKLFGSEYPSIAISLNNLGDVLRFAGQLAEAETIQRRLGETARKLVRVFQASGEQHKNADWEKRSAGWPGPPMPPREKPER